MSRIFLCSYFETLSRPYFEKFFWVLNFNASFDILDNIIVDHTVLFSLYKDKILKYGLHERREWLFRTAMFLWQIDLELNTGKKLVCFGV